MKYCALLFGYDQDTGPWETLTDEQQGAEMAKHGAFAEAVDVLSGEALMPGEMATTLSRRNGETIMTDGPYAEATEQIGGFYVFEAPDLDTAIELVSILPAYDIELRPVQEFE